MVHDERIFVQSWLVSTWYREMFIPSARFGNMYFRMMRRLEIIDC